MEEKFILLTKVAKKLCYKPNYVFLVRRVDDETALISLRCSSLPDSLKPRNIAGLTMNNTVKLSTIASPADALHSFAKVVADLELHEAAEFFQFDGRRVFLPHGWTDESTEAGNFTWEDFRNLSGRFLSGIKDFLGDL
jgi:hypothetical protein